MEVGVNRRKRLENALAAWIRAEYLFRLGRHAYSDQETEWYEIQTRKLRRALTGFGDLSRAHQQVKAMKTEESS